MRFLAATVLLLSLGACMHLPAEVAAVVREPDPPGRNNFRPDAPPGRAAADAGPQGR